MFGYNKMVFVSFFAICSILGFMVKLPRLFHHFDKELHCIFYLIATIILTFMFSKNWFFVITGLVFFGIIIEFAQEFSNMLSLRIIGKPIHGRFDIEDVKYNLIGVVLGLIIFKSYKFLLNLRS